VLGHQFEQPGGTRPPTWALQRPSDCCHCSVRQTAAGRRGSGLSGPRRSPPPPESRGNGDRCFPADSKHQASRNEFCEPERLEVVGQQRAGWVGGPHCGHHSRRRHQPRGHDSWLEAGRGAVCGAVRLVCWTCNGLMTQNGRHWRRTGEICRRLSGLNHILCQAQSASWWVRIQVGGVGRHPFRDPSDPWDRPSAGETKPVLGATCRRQPGEPPPGPASTTPGRALGRTIGMRVSKGRPPGARLSPLPSMSSTPVGNAAGAPGRCQFRSFGSPVSSPSAPSPAFVRSATPCLLRRALPLDLACRPVGVGRESFTFLAPPDGARRRCPEQPGRRPLRSRPEKLLATRPPAVVSRSGGRSPGVAFQPPVAVGWAASSASALGVVSGRGYWAEADGAGWRCPPCAQWCHRPRPPVTGCWTTRCGW